MRHEARLRRLEQTLAHHKIDALLVAYPANLRYLCGFTGSAGVLLVAEGGSTLFTDGRYGEQARTEVSGAKPVIARRSPWLTAAEWLARRADRQRVGVESEHMTLGERSRLIALFPQRCRVRQVPSLVEEARIIKDEEEIRLIRHSVRLAASVFDTALKNIRPGVRESEVAAEMEYAARKAGAEAMSFETIIASGKRSALPHGRASRSFVPRQGFVVCDFGVILAGYCSDMTRSLYVGHPGKHARRIYEVVREAQQAGIDAVQPGVSVGEVDRAARNVLKKAGLGRYFTHSTGHGVGLEIHEPPRIAAAQPDVLRPGMVITIEPGAYVPGQCGVRIEDMVVVRERGCQVLTPTSKELIAV